MPSKPKKSGGVGRYDMAVITAQVEKLRKKRGVEVKTICEAIGLEKWDWSRKVRQDRSTFSIPEISLIAEYLDAPLGWPFVPEEVGQLIEKALSGSK